MTASISELKQLVIAKLQAELPQGIFYHVPEHTLDVFNRATELARQEKFTPSEIYLLGVAALFHDTGYILSHKDHEANSCKIAREILSPHGFSEFDIEQICELIMATKIPQTPPNKLAMVLCDADLDYLGRDDFFRLGEKLHQEMVYFGTVKSDGDWHQLQIKFLEAHHYFTETEKELRDDKKQEHLAMLKEMKI